MTDVLTAPFPRHAAAPRRLGKSRSPLWHPMTAMRGYDSAEHVIARAEGVRVWDESGRCYLDAISGLWNVNFGYGHPAILSAIRGQLDVLAYGPLFGGRANRPAIELAQRLLDIGPVKQGRVFFSASGGTGIDTALKLARRGQRLDGHPERDVVVGLVGSYHGTAYGATAVTGEDLEQHEYATDLRHVRHVSPFDPEDLHRLIAAEGDRLAAIVVEPVLGTGAHVLGAEMVAAIDDVRRDSGAFVIVDEVTTGFGRTGTAMASEKLGLNPDVVVLSKGLTGGYLPLAATVCGEAICDLFDDHDARFAHGETQSGNPVAAAAALAASDVLLAPGFLDAVRSLSDRFEAGLDRLVLQDPAVAGHRGLGMLRAVSLRGADGGALDPRGVARVLDGCRREGVLVYASPGGIGLLPPLTTTADELDEMLDGVARGIVAAGI